MASVTAVFLAALVTSAGASAGVSLSLSGNFKRADMTACGIVRPASYYHVGDRVSYHGSVSPAPPADSTVKVVVRRCFTDHWETVKTMFRKTRADGTFRGSFEVHTKSKCFVRAIYAGDASARRFFRVVR